MKLKELNIEERPRERLIAKGSSALGNAELLAILLRTGSGNKNVLEMSHELLAAAGSLTELSAMSIDKMQAIGGIGKTRPRPSRQHSSWDADSRPKGPARIAAPSPMRHRYFQ